jgi:hypothetical protein
MPRLFRSLGTTSSIENLVAQIPVISVLTEITEYTIIHSVSIISAQSWLAVTSRWGGYICQMSGPGHDWGDQA